MNGGLKMDEGSFNSQECNKILNDFCIMYATRATALREGISVHQKLEQLTDALTSLDTNLTAVSQYGDIVGERGVAEFNARADTYRERAREIILQVNEEILKVVGDKYQPLHQKIKGDYEV